MKKILITDSLKDLKLKVGEKVELYKRTWKYGEQYDDDKNVVARYLDPQ